MVTRLTILRLSLATLFFSSSHLATCQVACFIDASVLSVVDGNCSAGGSAVIRASTGSSPFTYTLINNESGDILTNSTGIFSGLDEGDYSVVVIDVLGCGLECQNLSLVIENSTTSFTHVAEIEQGCDEEDGSTVVLIPNSGSAPFLYSLGNGFQSSSTFFGLPSGTYQTLVLDSNGCQSTLEVVVDPIIPLSVQLVSRTNEFCSNGEGQIVLDARGGTSPYTYGLYNIFAANFQTNATGTFDNLSAGLYYYFVTDANGCRFFPPFSSIVFLRNINFFCDIFGRELAEEGDLENNMITLAPNPTQDQVSLQVRDFREVGLVQLLGQEGQVLRQGQVSYNKSQMQWDVSDLAAGSYYIYLLDAEGVPRSVKILLITR